MTPIKMILWIFAQAVSILGFMWTRNPFILVSAIGWFIGGVMPSKWFYRLDKKPETALLDWDGPCSRCGSFHIVGHERCET